ncbi:MAG: CDP-alcohol phosphatidyltransferase family protein [Patescibacteria group bacterium]
MPPKIGIIQKARDVIDLWLLRLPWPKVNPNYISYLALPFSLIFILLWDRYKLLSFFVLVFVLILDWMDGLVAKKYQTASEEGWLVDVTTDRLSEGVIFIHFFHPWFYLFLVNLFLTAASFKFKKFSFILPLRHLLFLYLIAYYSFYYFISR